MAVNRKVGGSDEWYTPSWAVYPLVLYLKPGSTIWCPFDTEESNYYKVFKREGHNVIHTHISEGKDFLKAKIKSPIDYIISNPPYSIRNEVYAKLVELNKPFAMLYNVNGLFDNKLRMLFAKEYGVQLLYIYPRVCFYDENGVQNRPAFQSVYLCRNVLPEQIMFYVKGK